MTQSGIKLDGLQEVYKMFDDIAPRDARNLNRAAVHGLAGVVRDEARQNAPRDEGVLKKAIKSVRRRPKNPDFPFSDVMVTHGRSVKNDAFYWRFVEYGTVDQPARPFLQPAVDNLRGQVSAIYTEQFMKKYARLLKRKAKRGR